MRTYLLLAAALIAGIELSARVVSGADDFPYTAYVAVEEAEVRSGPSRTHYVTYQLFAGDKVEVYRRDAAGWLGIRPPADSFSWIPADVTEETEQAGVYRVLAETPAFIGSPLVTIQDHKYQVKLRAGELIEVIGQKTLPGEEGDETWLKIAPPAGEFRWIHTNSVSRAPPREADLADRRATLTPRVPTKRSLPEMQAAIGTGVSRAKESLEALASIAPAAREIRPAQHAIVLTDLSPANPEPISRREGRSPDLDEIRLTQFQQSTEAPRDNGIAPDGFVPRKPRRIESSAGVPAPSSDLRMASRESMQGSFRDNARGIVRSTTPAASNQSPSLPAMTSAASAAPRALARDDGAAFNGATFDGAAASDKLKQLDTELSLHVAQPRPTWNLEPIRTQVQKLVDRGDSPVERGQARLLLEKIRRFEETFDLPSDPLLAAHRNGTSPSDARYDGVGMLQPVLSRAGQTALAPYAIVDRDGNPVAFVTPGPGMNLRRYENKPVGIYGKRGMIEAIRKPHLVAERVIDLSQR